MVGRDGSLIGSNGVVQNASIVASAPNVRGNAQTADRTTPKM